MIRQSPRHDVFSLFDSIAQSTMFPVQVTRTGPTTSRSASRTGMPIDCYASDDHAVVLASVPGVHPDDISVSVNKNMLTISGAVMSDRKQQDEHGETVTWYMAEIPRGMYERTLKLPFPVDEDRVEAQFSNGMLRVVLPRLEATKPRRISVQVMESRFPEIAAETDDDESFSAD